MINGQKKIAAIAGIALIGVVVVSALIKKGYHNYFRHKAGRVREIFQNNKAYDILYLGSSRMHNAINPQIIDSVTGFKSYNAGVEGGNMFEFKMTFDGYLVNHPPPSVMILSIDAKSFDIKKDIFFPPQYFECLDNPVVYNGMSLQKDYNTFLIRYLPFSRIIYYDDFTKIKAVSGLLGANEMKQLNSFEYNGFLSNGNACIDTSIELKQPSVSFSFQKDAVNWLQQIITKCKREKIELLITFSPEYRYVSQQSVENFPFFSKLLDSMATVNGLPVYRDDSLELCRYPCNFANPTHLNTRGAAVYSAVIAQRISNLVQSKAIRSFWHI